MHPGLLSATDSGDRMGRRGREKAGLLGSWCGNRVDGSMGAETGSKGGPVTQEDKELGHIGFIPPAGCLRTKHQTEAKLPWKLPEGPLTPSLTTVALEEKCVIHNVVSMFAFLKYEWLGCPLSC